ETKMTQFNNNAKFYSIKSFEWKSVDGVYWVFGFRAGNGPRKVSLICHLDTVPPGNNEWKPFEPRCETRIYKGVPTEFLIGRGSIDDKGPAVVAFEAFTRAVKKANESSTALDNVTLEVLFDTSEETDMSTSHYFDAKPTEKPTFGIVFDALWSIRAEKGIERPIFTINSKDVKSTAPTSALKIDRLFTSEGSTNMIPVTAEAHITSTDKELVSNFAKNVDAMYRACQFDDPQYHPADISVKHLSDFEVVIITKVAGAQHGSAPHQNRATGANPLVSITNFLASLVDRDILANNYYGEMCRFIRWAFGTHVFGENQPDLLKRYDSIFSEDNGTTYGLTKLSDNSDNVSLYIDIRYAIGHHEKGWDGSEGKIEGNSLFKKVFETLVKQYYFETGGAKVSVKTETVFGPDIRSPRNENLFNIDMAYRSIMGENCPMQAIGGATDAHGYLELATAGALFTDSLGTPVNYHGLDEGAPITDLENSGKILLYLLTQELQLPEKPQSDHAEIHVCHGCAI
ncbi:MAG TPA: M20/M25/M40 family metallo-hydrolase, partial [Paludibacter sp.]|nr:M20/M25/M40 family metallo-hydrolase [Paludibacter sp.]